MALALEVIPVMLWGAVAVDFVNWMLECKSRLIGVRADVIDARLGMSSVMAFENRVLVQFSLMGNHYPLSTYDLEQRTWRLHRAT